MSRSKRASVPGRTRYLRTAEAAELIGVTRSLLLAWARDGVISDFRCSGGQPPFRRLGPRKHSPLAFHPEAVDELRSLVSIDSKIEEKEK